MDRLTGRTGVLQGHLQPFQRPRFGLFRICLERPGAARRFDPAGGDGDKHLVQALGSSPEQAESPQQHHSGNGVGRLHQAGAGEIVVHEPLGAKPRQQALRHALLQVQMHGVVGEHPGVLEDHRSNGRFLPPFGELLVGLAWGAEGIQGSGPARIRLRFAGKRRKHPDCVAVLGAIVAATVRRPSAPGSRTGRRGTVRPRTAPSVATVPATRGIVRSAP